MNIVIYGQPQGKARPRFRRIGNFVSTYTTKETKDYEKLIKDAWIIKGMGNEFYKEEPLFLRVSAFYEIPKSWSKKKKNDASDGKIRPCVKPDIDNILKIVMDALNGIAYADDKQICAVYTRKKYSIVPRLEIELDEIKE